jgi:hypothetical protein
MTPRLEIVVDELVVRGLSPAKARELAAALESRLTALAHGHEGQLRGRAESFRRLEPVTAKPERLGGAVADRVWSEVAR